MPIKPKKWCSNCKYGCLIGAKLFKGLPCSWLKTSETKHVMISEGVCIETCAGFVADRIPSDVMYKISTEQW